MQIKELTNYLETIAPPSYQENYDNAGLIVGDSAVELKGVLICLDAIEAIIDEAIELGCNLVIAHHPIVFRGLKRLNGKNYVERVVMKAIKNDIAIYAIHTNLDNVYQNGVNAKIAEKLGLQNTHILAPKQTLKKLIAYSPIENAEATKQALFEAGAEAVNGFNRLSLSASNSANLTQSNEINVRLEVLFSSALKRQILSALNQATAENIFYEMFSVENFNEKVGSGMIGDLAEATNEKSFLLFLKKTMKAGVVRHTKLKGKSIKKVAVCGGAGGFLLKNAIAQKADIFVTADYKYHEFFDANDNIIIADIGHFESEQFTIELLYEIITNKFSNFAAHCTKINTNPVNYL
jgi:dinuclear metal center YbgI/SA1388 family protein